MPGRRRKTSLLSEAMATSRREEPAAAAERERLHRDRVWRQRLVLAVTVAGVLLSALTVYVILAYA